MPVILVPFTPDHAVALIRVVVGLLLVGHGAQKLFGAFGGHGIRGVAGWLGSLGVPAPTALAWLVGLCEFVGGLLFAVGLFSPIAALAISAVMLGAIVLVHGAKGIWVTSGGFEYPLVLLAIAAAVGLAGPGRYALDAVYGIVLPASANAIYLVGLLIEVVVLAAIQVARARRPLGQPTAARGM
jgi:putative oxidoreductase